jgi:hypothetical protein
MCNCSRRRDAVPCCRPRYTDVPRLPAGSLANRTRRPRPASYSPSRRCLGRPPETPIPRITSRGLSVMLNPGLAFTAAARGDAPSNAPNCRRVYEVLIVTFSTRGKPRTRQNYLAALVHFETISSNDGRGLTYADSRFPEPAQFCHRPPSGDTAHRGRSAALTRSRSAAPPDRKGKDPVEASASQSP